MTLEEVRYYSILLGVGEFDEFKEYIIQLMNGAGEIDDIESELLFVSENMSKCCDILSSCTLNKNLDDAVVAFKLINFVKQRIECGELNQAGAIAFFEKCAREANKIHEDKLEEPWVTMRLLSLIGTKDAIIYDSDFENFINSGKILTENDIVQAKLKELFGQNN